MEVKGHGKLLSMWRCDVTCLVPAHLAGTKHVTSMNLGRRHEKVSQNQWRRTGLHFFYTVHYLTRRVRCWSLSFLYDSFHCDGCKLVLKQKIFYVCSSSLSCTPVFIQQRHINHLTKTLTCDWFWGQLSLTCRCCAVLTPQTEWDLSLRHVKYSRRCECRLRRSASVIEIFFTSVSFVLFWWTERVLLVYCEKGNIHILIRWCLGLESKLLSLIKDLWF